MLWLLLGISTACRGSAADGGFRTSKPEVRKDVIAVIEAQLAAFRTRDIAKAYGYAAAWLHAQTPLRAFSSIVQNNYPEIWAGIRAEYRLVRDDGTHATVLAHVFAKDSNAAYDYVLVKERGGWRIGSVLRHEPRKKDNV